MNAIQRGILIAGATLGLLIGLFPPWIYGVGRPLGIHFIFTPPTLQEWSSRTLLQFDRSCLVLEFVTLVLFIGTLFFAARTLKHEDTK